MPVNAIIIGEERQRRSANAKHYRLSDGSIQAIIGSAPFHYHDADGQWHNIDTNLFDEAEFDLIDGPVSARVRDIFQARRQIVAQARKNGTLDRSTFSFAPLRVPFVADIPRLFRRGYSVGKGENKVTFKPVGASVSFGNVNRESGRSNVIEYADVWNDTDVMLEVTDSGIKETIILKTDNSPAAFSFELVGELDVSEFKLLPAWLIDANGQRRDVSQTIRTQGSRKFVDLAADISGLVYPILVDPTVSQATSQDTYLISNAGTSHGNDANLRIGQGAFDTSTVYYGALGFNMAGAPASLISASLKVYVSDTVVASSTTIRPQRMTAAWVDTMTSYGLSIVNDGDPVFEVLNVPKFAWLSIDVTKILQQRAAGQPFYGVWLQTAGYVGNGSYLTFDSMEGANKPYLVITYNDPPTAPVVTAPNGGETWNASHTITWTSATDSNTPQSSLQYHIQFSPDNGATWSDIVALTAAGATSYTYDFSSIAATTSAKIRIRAWDGFIYGGWDPSNAVFTILHNVAPLAPTNLSPANNPRDRALLQRLSWQHNDPNGDPQSKFDLQWRKQGDAAWNTVSQITNNQYWDAPANTFPYGTIEWQVRTYDQANLAGSYSPQVSFTAGDKPVAPTITSPGTTTPVARPLVQWSSFGQTSFQLQVLNQAQTVTIWDSGEVITGNKAVMVGTDLENGTSYALKLKIKNTDGLWSDPTTASFTVSFTAPRKPVVTLARKVGSQLVTIANPVPTGTEPNTLSNDLYRRKMGETLWVSLATGLPLNTSYEDFTAASGIRYEYMARAQGSNGSTGDSATVSGVITFIGVWMHDIADPAGTIRRYKLDGTGRSASRQQDVTMMKYAGRILPAAEFGESAEHKVPVQLEITRTSGDLEALQTLVESCATICYRDGRGRKVIGIIPSLTENDVRQAGYTVSFEINGIEGEATPRSPGSVTPPVTTPGGTTPPPTPNPTVAEVVAVRTITSNGQITRVQELDSLGAAVTQADLAWNVDGSLQNIIEQDEWGKRHLVTLNYDANGNIDPVNPVTRMVIS